MKIPKFNLWLLLEFRTFVIEKFADVQASEFMMVFGQVTKLNPNEYHPPLGFLYSMGMFDIISFQRGQIMLKNTIIHVYYLGILRRTHTVNGSM